MTNQARTVRVTARPYSASLSPDLLELVWGPIAVATALLIYVPTYIKLYDGPWQTEQEGHGPLIMAASAWLVWRRRKALSAAPVDPAFIRGWMLLAVGLVLMAVARSQDLLVIEAASQIPVLLAIVLLSRGGKAARVIAFPLSFLFFAVPPPGWALDALTVPLKGWISDVVVSCLYRLGYPIAQNGVVIMVGTYQLMVKDACSGMNSIFALSAIGIFYIHEFVGNAPFRTTLLVASILPITILANLLRVTALVLASYSFGPDNIEGFFHDATGMILFVTAVLLFFLEDRALAGSGTLLTRLTRRRGMRLEGEPQ